MDKSHRLASMTEYKLAIVMDPLELIKPWKDSSVAMMLEAQARGWTIHYLTINDIYMDNSISHARYQVLKLTDDNEQWYEVVNSGICRLDSFNVILMRKDPPFDLEYIYCTYLLEQAEEAGVLVVNKTISLRNCNEKLFTRYFPQCCVETRVSRNIKRLNEFIEQYQDCIVKPLDGMGGQSIFRVKSEDGNRNVILETVTRMGTSQTMIQRYIPEISAGDKRILMIDGKPIAYALARLPAIGENRGNIAAGATTRGQLLSKQDQWLCEQVGPELRKRGLYFAGLDVIGSYITEINVTSPTGIRELDHEFNLNISADLFNCLEYHLTI